MRFSRNNIMGSRGLFFSLSLWVCTVSINQAADTITRGQSIRDGQTLVSAGERFELGFFSPVNSTKRYVGIWYFHHKVPIPTVVWVANRENPISDSSGVDFTVGDDWNLVILDSKKSSLIWSSNVSEHSSNSTALLSDSGNLILRDGISGDNLWESFHHPTDSFLPGMKLGLEGLTGRQIVHTSWKSPADPAVGDFSVNVVSRGAAQIVVLNRGRRHWRSGQWDGETFAGVANKRPIYLFGLRLTYDDQNGNKLFSFALFNNSDFVMYRIRWDGQEQHLSWDGNKNEWVVPRSQPMDACEEYGKCGEFGICRTSGTVDSAACTCLKGFEPRSGEEWRKGNWADGCSRRTPLSCGSNSSSTTPGGSTHRDGFFRVEGVKLPDYEDWVVVPDEGDCEQSCLGNCSCIAYAYVGGIGCLQWGTNLVDIRHFQEGENRLFLRLAASELGDHNGMTTIIIVTTVLAALVLTSACSIILWRRRRNLKGWGKFRKGEKIFIDLQKELELGRNKVKKPHMPLFDYQSLVLATNHFSDANKLGQGGFGPVYKGCGAGGQEVAIKRLSSGSGQGVEEFMNEVILFSNLQHRNLVRLLGCCIHGEEQMLVYEFMSNKSLDLFLFDSRKRETLDWTKRFNIINGIARGLLYLHRDSSLRIIHRDLKAGNILLDEEMKPKIADFGIARIFGGNQYQATTRRVMGTYGYMSPEYALEGSFSSKSDVYSFGVLVLEIVTGKKNSAFYVEDQALHLTGYAWKLWNEDISVAALLDATIRDSCNKREVMRSVHLGLLCVQDLPSDRPEICYIASMLDSEASIDLMPKQPKFVTARSMEITPERSSFYSFSTNDLTFTLPLGR